MTTFINMLIVEPAMEMVAKIAAFVPALVGTLLVLVVGILAAKILRDVLHRLFKAMKIDYLADEAGIGVALNKGGIKHKLSDILAGMVYWVILLVTLIATVNALGIPGAYGYLDRFLDYVPHVVLAAFVLVLGSVIAYFLASLIEASIKAMGFPEPEFPAKIAKYAVTLFAVVVAMEELGLGYLFSGTISYIFFGGIALAFGLGGREAAGRFLDDLRKKR